MKLQSLDIKEWVMGHQKEGQKRHPSSMMEVSNEANEVFSFLNRGYSKDRPLSADGSLNFSSFPTVKCFTSNQTIKK